MVDIFSMEQAVDVFQIGENFFQGDVSSWLRWKARTTWSHIGEKCINFWQHFIQDFLFS